MNKTTRAVTQNEYEEILKVLIEGYKDGEIWRRPNEQLCMILMCEGNLGCRICDVLCLTLNCFTIMDNRCVIDIIERKTKKARHFSCNLQFYLFLQDYCMRNGITNRDRKIFDIGERAVQKSLKHVCDFLELESIGSHSFRKFFATNIYNASKNLAYVQRVLMHQSSATTLKYIGMEEPELERILRESVHIPTYFSTASLSSNPL